MSDFLEIAFRRLRYFYRYDGLVGINFPEKTCYITLERPPGAKRNPKPNPQSKYFDYDCRKSNRFVLMVP